MDISKRELKISGTLEIPEGLEFQRDYTIVLTGSVVKKDLKDQQDGSFIERFTIKGVDVNIS